MTKKKIFESKLTNCCIVPPEDGNPIFNVTKRGVMCCLDGYLVCPLTAVSPGELDLIMHTEAARIERSFPKVPEGKAVLGGAIMVPKESLIADIKV